MAEAAIYANYNPDAGEEDKNYTGLVKLQTAAKSNQAPNDIRRRLFWPLISVVLMLVAAVTVVTVLYAIQPTRNTTTSDSIRPSSDDTQAPADIRPHKGIPYMMVMAGLDEGNNKLKTVELYNMEDGTLSQASSMPIELDLASITVHNNIVYLISGRDKADKSSAKVFMYYPVTGQWSRGSDVNRARREAVALTIGDSIVLLGGHNGPPLASIEVYNIKQDAWTLASTSLPYGLFASAGCVIGSVGYLIAGYKGGATRDIIEIRHVNITNEIQLIQHQNVLSKATHDHSVTTDGVNIFIFGGRGTPSDVLMYNPETRQVTTLPSMPRDRMYTMAVFHQGAAYLPAGSGTSRNHPTGSQATDTILRYNVTADNWTELTTKLASRRFWHCAAIIYV
jgi:hypothetical protein